jgi:hypothetical protein
MLEAKPRDMIIRRLILTLSALSLLVGVTLIAAAVRGQSRADWLVCQRTDPNANTFRALEAVGGTSGIHLTWRRFDFQTPGGAVVHKKWLRHGGRSFFHEALTPPHRNPFADGSFLNQIGLGYAEHNWVLDHRVPIAKYRGHAHRAHAPYWALIPLFLSAGLPAVRGAVAWRRRVRRAAAGRCPSCGYDLRATPQPGGPLLPRCPECGAAARTPTPQPAAHAAGQRV